MQLDRVSPALASHRLIPCSKIEKINRNCWKGKNDPRVTRIKIRHLFLIRVIRAIRGFISLETRSLTLLYVLQSQHILLVCLQKEV